MMKLLRSLKSSKSGASAAEYALIVAIMGGLVVAGTFAFGTNLSKTLTDTGTALEAESTTSFKAAPAAP